MNGLCCRQEWKEGALRGLIVHQDQGSPYTSGDYVTTVLENQVFVSSSQPAIPGDNPVNESFFSGFKAEWSEQVVEMKTFETLCRLLIRTIAITIRKDSR